MREDQLKLVREMAEDHDRSPRIRALAQVVLELANDKDKPAIPLRSGSAPRVPLRDQMKAVLVQENITPSIAERMLDEMFDILEQDPGHDATSYALAPGENRVAIVEQFGILIRAIRRGE